MNRPLQLMGLLLIALLTFGANTEGARAEATYGVCSIHYFGSGWSDYCVICPADGDCMWITCSWDDVTRLACPDSDPHF